RFICRVTFPLASVGCSAGIVNWLKGTAVTYTSAPLTDWPQLSETWKRATIERVKRPSGFGVTLVRSTVSRAGAVTFPTETGPGPGGQPVAGLGGGGGGPAGFLITAVGTEVAVAEPAVFLAVTRTRTVLPTSAEVSR